MKTSSRLPQDLKTSKTSSTGSLMRGSEEAILSDNGEWNVEIKMMTVCMLILSCLGGDYLLIGKMQSSFGMKFRQDESRCFKARPRVTLAAVKNHFV